ncbi:unnamed protein product, partial [marine sediment metagenome]
VTIDANADSRGTRWSGIDSICIGEEVVPGARRLHVAYNDLGANVGYAYSDDSGGTWETPSTPSVTGNSIGVVCNGTSGVLIYYYHLNDIDAFYSDDSGETFGNEFSMIDVNPALRYASCAVDTNDIVHCCVIDYSYDLYYRNSTQWGYVESGVVSDDTYYNCDIEVDKNNRKYIAATGSDDDLVIFYTDATGWSSHTAMTAATVYTSGYQPSIAIYDEQIWVAWIDNGDLWLSNSTIGSITNWRSVGYSESPVKYHPSIAVNAKGEIRITETRAISSDHTTSYWNDSNWNAEGEFSDSILLASHNYCNIANQNFPESARMTNASHIVCTDISARDIIYEQKPVPYDTGTETNPPTYSNFQKNSTKIYNDDYIQFNITIADSLNNVYNWTFSWNDTDTWVNISNGTGYSSTPIIAMANNTVTSTAGNTIGLQFCACDDVIPKNCGCDEIRTFYVNDKIPPYYSNNYNNGSTIKTGGNINFSINMTDDVQLANISIFWNDTGSWVLLEKKY